MSAYRIAIDHTARTIARRARYFRNQVVIVVAIGALAVIAAVVTRSAAPLWGWLLLVPVCGLFLLGDNNSLQEWRSVLVESWVGRHLDFAAFRQAIRANPALPKETTEGMLMTLPSAGDLFAEQQVLTPTRQAIAAVSLALNRDSAERLLLNVIASGILVGVLLAALWLRAWAPFLGLSILVLLPLGRRVTGRRRQARCEAEVAACRVQAGFSESEYERIRAALR